MKALQKISGGLVVFAFLFMFLSPLLGVHVHANGTIHSHSTTTKHNQSDKSIPQNEIPSLLLNLVSNKSLPVEIVKLLWLLVFSLLLFTPGKIIRPEILKSFSGSIRDGTTKLPSPPCRIVGQRAPPLTPSLA